MSQELKPCPLCNYPLLLSNDHTWWVHSWNEQCCLDPVRIKADDEARIASWNTRVSDSRIAELEAEVERLRAGPKVEPLEWKEEGKGRWIGMPTGGLGHLAYWIFLQSDGYVGWDGAKREVYPTLDAAKAFYQADYEARILSALVQP